MPQHISFDIAFSWLFSWWRIGHADMCRPNGNCVNYMHSILLGHMVNLILLAPLGLLAGKPTAALWQTMLANPLQLHVPLQCLIIRTWLSTPASSPMSMHNYILINSFTPTGQPLMLVTLKLYILVEGGTVTSQCLTTNHFALEKCLKFGLDILVNWMRMRATIDLFGMAIRLDKFCMPQFHSHL